MMFNEFVKQECSLKNPLDLGDKMYIRLATNQSYSEVMQHLHKSL